MTLADGAGKSDSVPLAQPSGAAAGGDSTKLKAKEDVKMGEFGRLESPRDSILYLNPSPSFLLPLR